jgi:hypothetical protein
MSTGNRIRPVCRSTPRWNKRLLLATLDIAISASVNLALVQLDEALRVTLKERRRQPLPHFANSSPGSSHTCRMPPEG